MSATYCSCECADCVSSVEVCHCNSFDTYIEHLYNKMQAALIVPIQSFEQLLAITTIKDCSRCGLAHAQVRSCEEMLNAIGRTLCSCGRVRDIGVPCDCGNCPG